MMRHGTPWCLLGSQHDINHSQLAVSHCWRTGCVSYVFIIGLRTYNGMLVL